MAHASQEADVVDDEGHQQRPDAAAPASRPVALEVGEACRQGFFGAHALLAAAGVWAGLESPSKSELALRYGKSALITTCYKATLRALCTGTAAARRLCSAALLFLS